MLEDIVTVVLQPDEENCRKIIDEISKGELSDEVVDSINKYSRGNFGVATALTKLSLRRNVKFANEVETIVGWPLWSHTLKKTALLWDKIKNEA